MSARKAAALIIVVSSSPLVCSFAAAQAPDLVFQNDVRLRFEQVGAAGETPGAEALTVRMRPSIELKASPRLSGVVELDLVSGLIDDDRNGFFTRDGRPVIPDPEGISLNRLQIDYAPTDSLTFTAGRQRLSLRNERFLGISDFRQNQQTYDAVTGQVALKDGVTVNAGYIWQVNRFIGERRAEGQLDSESFFVAASLPSPVGTLSAFHLDLDVDSDAEVFSQSRTSGIALDGRAFRNGVGVRWTGSLAVQYRGGAKPAFAEIGATIDWDDVSLALRAERLGSDDGVALQTPLGTLHRFNGAADVFTTTPIDGLQDLEVKATWRLGSLGSLRATRVSLSYNDYTPAREGPTYGREWGALAATRIGPVKLSLAWAGYDADSFAQDIDKIWVTFSSTF